ncbi:hypothetical protein AX16_006079 [Volvariella volvacea WC 439]|nr:hypothetical protein AX16_006079 [Volvariella volvacea WC 439]
MPLMTYSFQLWYRPYGKRVKHKIEVLKTAQNRALRWITGTFHTTPNDSTEGTQRDGRPPTHPTRYPLSYMTPMQHPQLMLPQHALGPQTLQLNIFDATMRIILSRSDGTCWSLKTPLANDFLKHIQAESTLISPILLNPPPTHITLIQLQGIKSPSLTHIDTTPIIIFSDGSERNDHQYASGSAFTAYTQNARIVLGKKFAGRCTNYEAEIYGMGLGILHSLANIPLVRIWGKDPVFAEIRHLDHLIIAADNEAAMKCLLSPDTHAAQSLSIPVIRAVKTWLDADDRRTITFIHCPAHKGIELNEKVDKDAKAAALVWPDAGPVPRFIAWERAKIDRKALEIWRNLPVEHWGKSSHFLREHSNWKNQGGIHMKKFGNDVRRYTQFVRSLLAHAPIGQYRSRFFPDEPTHCPTCYVYQDRYHVMFECRAINHIPALTPTNSKMRRIRQYEDRNLRFRKHIELSPLKVGKSKTPSIMASYFEWLKANPIAFTFEGTPPTLPG